MTTATTLTRDDRISTPGAGTRLTDRSAHRHAVEHAISVLGLEVEPEVFWDHDHRLQGHLEVSGRHLVLIAPRTSNQVARLLSAEEWDGLRRGLRAA